MGDEKFTKMSAEDGMAALYVGYGDKWRGKDLGLKNIRDSTTKAVMLFHCRGCG